MLKSQYRSKSLTTVVGELAMYKLHLVGVQEVRWDRARTIPAGDFMLFYGKGNNNHQLGTGFLVHHRIVPAVKVEFVSDRMPYIVPTKKKNGDSKDSSYEVLELVFDHFPM